MTWEQLSALTPDNGAIKSLKELLVMTNFLDEELEKFFTLKQNVTNGQKLGWVGEMNDIGWAGAGCNPTYKKPTINFAEKTWEIGDWKIPLTFCYEDLKNTIAEYCLKKGTEIGDLTATEYMDDIVYPALDLAIKHMMWRFIWFGDKDATAISSSTSGDVTTYTGSITDGVDVDLFKTCNGLWKQLFSLGTVNASQVTSIAANSEKTFALQKSKLLESGVAIKIFDDMFMNADSRIASMEGAGVFCTKSLTDALQRDLKREYKLILDWQQVFKGLDVAEYDGNLIYRVSIWDRFIQKYQNNGAFLNKPHRALFGTPKNIFVGTPAKALISDLDIWFEKKERANYIYSTGKLGALIGEDNLFQMAY